LADRPHGNNWSNDPARALFSINPDVSVTLTGKHQAMLDNLNKLRVKLISDFQGFYRDPGDQAVKKGRGFQKGYLREKTQGEKDAHQAAKSVEPSFTDGRSQQPELTEKG